MIDALLDSEIREHTGDLSHSPYWNGDIAPTRKKERTWAQKDIMVLWISMCACVPTYMLASSLIAEGMNWWQAVLTIFLGNCIVLIPMILNAHAGTKYGIPFPVYCRPAFGILGANVPALLRAMVACGWFGIQSWIGGSAIFTLLAIWFPALKAMPASIAGISAAQFACFMFFWAINMFVIYKGVESIRFLLNIKAPLLITLGLALLFWAYGKANGFGPMLAAPSAFDPGQPKAGQFWAFFFPALTGMIGFWATLSLNIPDFTRYAKSQKDQILGQALGLPTTMGLFSFIGVAVTSATVVIYGKSIWDPVELLTKFSNPILLAFAMVSLCIATLATNIAANVVSPANDIAHLWPKKIDFRMGGYITGVIGILMQPWKLLADPSGYIFKWLVAYSSLLGSIGGVLICDYFILRHCELNIAELYEHKGRYWYGNGFNARALIALILGIVPLIPGFLGTIGAAQVAPFWTTIYSYAWFISFGISFALYWLLMSAYKEK
ncbi:MAG: NCS1 family nucleobase:cation symporter-1 [Elusimicrobia bacterium]|nr:NCS1 family nucleobase:cation symporter-1 [Elusimicrobiota bacterium]